MKKLLLMIALFSVTYQSFAANPQFGSVGPLPINKLTYIEGRLESVVGIGGESTGMALKTASGEYFEVKGLNRSVSEFLYAEYLDQGTLIILKGLQTIVRGVEVPSRSVFSVYSAFKNEIDATFTVPVPLPLPRICGLGGGKYEHPISKKCVQSLSTCESADLVAEGYKRVNSCS